ncbi:MAG: hypothetical protein RML99_05105 [Anaerolineae bacterium]|nr:hypothetical protein [Anaerolineae bacterium]
MMHRPARQVEQEERAGRLEHANILFQPGFAPAQIGLLLQLVVVGGIRLVQVIGRVGEDQVNRLVGKPSEHLDGVALHDAVLRHLAAHLRLQDGIALRDRREIKLPRLGAVWRVGLPDAFDWADYPIQLGGILRVAGQRYDRQQTLQNRV